MYHEFTPQVAVGLSLQYFPFGRTTKAAKSVVLRYTNKNIIKFLSLSQENLS